MIRTHASLFSGIGGAELAASWLNFKNLFHCEIQEFQRKVLEYWFPNSVSYENITKTNFTEWRGKVDILTGGFPCQPFSVAGKRLGTEDDRALWPEMLRAIREIQPTWVVGENVAGILSMVQPGETVKVGCTTSLFGEDDDIYRKEQQFVVETVCTDLEREGYSVQPFVIPACAVGAPHQRDRVWIVAQLVTDGTDARAESVQQGRQDGVYEFVSAANAQGTGSKGQLLGQQTQIQSDRQDSRIDKPDFSDFPTQSPVCRGNDGLPFRVADLAISFPAWRSKSIEALGNSWCPQVAYEIFKAIEQTDIDNNF